MNEEEFAKAFERLPPRRRQVLLRVLAGETDAEIAMSLGIQEATVRKHLERIYLGFGVGKRVDLLALFVKCKPELIGSKNTDALAHSSTSEGSASESQGRELSYQKPLTQPLEIQNHRVKSEGQWKIDDGELTFQGLILLETVRLRSQQLEKILEILGESSGGDSSSEDGVEEDSEPEAARGLTLEFSLEEMKKAWPPEEDYSNEIARGNAYWNCICLNVLVPILQEYLEEKISVWPNRGALACIWEFVNGTAIELGQTRIVLISDEDLECETEEFCVPQEWIDIPGWSAHYYLQVEISENGWIKVYGYATHKQLKREGQYEESDRTYSLGWEDLNRDLGTMRVGKGVAPNVKAAIAPLPELSEVRAKYLLQKLGQASVKSPRLEVEFEKWGALLENEKWRQQLYERRLGLYSEPLTESNQVHLSQWLGSKFEFSWHKVEEIISYYYRVRPAFRRDVDNVKRAKSFALNNGCRVAMVVEVKPEEDNQFRICLELFPSSEQHLPPSVQMIVMDELEETFLEAKARLADRWLRLELTGNTGEWFFVKLELDGAILLENFII